MSTNEPYNTIWTGPNTTSADELATSIDEFLGIGLDETEWKNVLEAKGWEYNTNIRNTIIHQEFEYFIPEIKRLLAEPNIAQDSSKSNSRARIFKRIRGEKWVEGVPDEEAERRRNRMLYGKVAQLRVFQARIKRYVDETASVSHLSDSRFDGDSVEYPSTPGGTLEAFSGRTSVSPAALNNSYGYGVLVPNGCHPNASSKNSRIHNRVYTSGNNGTSLEPSAKRPAPVDSHVGKADTAYVYQQTDLTARSLPFTEASTQNSLGCIHLPSGISVSQESPGSFAQEHEPAFHTDINELVDYEAFYRAEDVTTVATRAVRGDVEMQAEQEETAFDVPYESGLNPIISPRQPQPSTSFDSTNSLRVAQQNYYEHHLESTNLHGAVVQSIPGNAYFSSPANSNDASPFHSGPDTSHKPPTKNHEILIHQPINNHPSPMSDTVMESGDLFQPQPTNRQIGLGLNEKDEIVMLQSLVQEQREQLRVRDVENLELRDTIKQLQALQTSSTLQIERIDQNNKRADQLLQKAIECGPTQNLGTKFPLGPSLCSPPKPNLSSKAFSGNGAYKVSSSVSHSRNKSTVSSSAGTATTSSSAAGNPKEVRRRIGELERKVKSILKTLKDNQNTSHGARLDEMKPKLRTAKENEDFINRDSGIVMGDSPRTSLAS